MTTPNHPPGQVERPTGQGMRVTKAAHAELSRLKFALIGKVGRDVSLSAAMRAACKVAADHIDETVAALDGRQDDSE